MSGPYRFVFERSTKHTCPQCGKPKRFVRYVDTETGELLPEHVGRCDRADKCGYSYTDKQYFADGGTRPTDGGTWTPKPEPPPRPPFLHHRAEVIALRAHPERNTLSAYWRDRIGADRWDKVAKDYALGTWTDGRLAGAAVYWQVDLNGKVKAGKIMQYDPATGKRSKVGSSTSFVHFERHHQSAHDLNVEQCLFGEHLLKSWPMDKPVAVVESEKTALIAAALLPTYCWVATGSKDEFKLAKLQALTGRKVIAFPDLSGNSVAYYQWKERAVELNALFASIHVSDILEAGATAADTEAGLDIGDYLLRLGTITPPTTITLPKGDGSDGRKENYSTPLPAITTTTILTPPPPMILSRAEVAVERMAAKNPAINLLVELLQLDVANATAYQLKRP